MLEFKKIKGNSIHKTAIINWKKVIMNNIIGPYAVIGNVTTSYSKQRKNLYLLNIINEYCNIHFPMKLQKKLL